MHISNLAALDYTMMTKLSRNQHIQVKTGNCGAPTLHTTTSKN